MKLKLHLGLALVLSGIFMCPISRAETNLIHAAKIPGIGVVNTVDLKIPGLSDTIFFNEQMTSYTVQMVMYGYRDNEKHTTPKPGDLHRQVWLLQPDGTAISQSQEPAVIGISNGGWTNDYLIFNFQKEPTNEVTGIVVSANGKLYCRELPKIEKNP